MLLFFSEIRKMENSSANFMDLGEVHLSTDPKDHIIAIFTKIFVPLIFGLIVFIGIFGNALVIIVVTINGNCLFTFFETVSCLFTFFTL